MEKLGDPETLSYADSEIDDFEQHRIVVDFFLIMKVRSTVHTLDNYSICLKVGEDKGYFSTLTRPNHRESLLFECFFNIQLIFRDFAKHVCIRGQSWMLVTT
jgi:hypothetical protein